MNHASRLEQARADQVPQGLARLVVVTLFIALWFGLFALRIPMPRPFLAALFAEALFFVVYLRAVPHLPSERAVRAAHYCMLAAEILFHTTMVYFLGGVTWLGAFAYVFGLIFTNTFLDPKRGLVYTAGAASAFSALALLDANSVIPHYAYLDQGPQRYADPRFVATTIVGGVGVFFSIFAWVNWVGHQLRLERDAAVRTQDSLLSARLKLQQANEELEARVTQRTEDLERANVALRGSDEVLRATIESTTDGILAFSEGRLVYMNSLFGQIWDIPRDVFDERDWERLAQAFRERIEDGDAFLEHIRDVYPTTREEFETLWFRDGRICECYSRPLLRGDEVVGRVWSFRDVTARKQAEALLRHRAERDALTDTLNHAAVTDVLRSVVASGVHGPGCAVAMVDVDGMKATNDTYGHQVGDAVLIAVADALARDGAIVGRYGGDEFVVVLPGAGRAEAERYRESVLVELVHTSVPTTDGDGSVPVLASIGLATYPAEAERVEDLIKLADGAMYAQRRQRPVTARRGDVDTRRNTDRAAQMVGEIVPLLTSAGTLDDKLRLVAHQLSIGAGYDSVAFEVFGTETQPALATASSLSGTLPSLAPPELVARWRAQYSQLRDHPQIGPMLERTRRPFIIEEQQFPQLLTPLEQQIIGAMGVRSGLIVPMLWHDELIGAIYVWSTRPRAFGPRDAQFLTSVAGQVTAIVHMATTSMRLQGAHERTVLMLASAAEAHDRTTGRHLQRVRAVSQALALELGQTHAEAHDLGLAAILHDIGKVRVPDAILASARELDQREWAIMEQHTIWGGEFLRSETGFDLAAVVASAHHERWDGAGYPYGLRGEEIPLAAAIVSVADSFDAMTNDRPYRAGRPVASAIAEIVACAGKQFNPRVVDALVRLHARGTLEAEGDDDVLAA